MTHNKDKHYKDASKEVGKILKKAMSRRDDPIKAINEYAVSCSATSFNFILHIIAPVISVLKQYNMLDALLWEPLQEKYSSLDRVMKKNLEWARQMHIDLGLDDIREYDNKYREGAASVFITRWTAWLKKSRDEAVRKAQGKANKKCISIMNKETHEKYLFDSRKECMNFLGVASEKSVQPMASWQ